MSKKLIVVILLTLGMVFQGASLWADDDAIMDVDDNAALFSGSWTTSKYRILYYGDDYEYHRGSGGLANTAEAIFTTKEAAGITGTYHVYVRWTAGSARATNARYRVYDGATSRGSCYFNQTANGGAWQFCRAVTLTEGRHGVVRLGNGNNTPTSRYVCADAVRFVRVSKDSNDIVDAPGYELSQKSSASLRWATLCSASSSSWSRLATVTLTNLPAHGIIMVRANGISKHYNDRVVRVCIARAGGSCASLAPYLDQSSREVAEGDWDNETRWVVSDTFPATGASQTFYLLGCRVNADANVTVMWDDFTAIYLPKHY